MKNDWANILRQDLTAYRCLPFWSWNDHLQDEELVRQIRQMKQAGMGGFFMHARSGLTLEYMSDAWFHAVDICRKEAAAQGMEAWCYDENGWPSGFAGMKLLEDPENWAHYLTCRKTDRFDPAALAVYSRQGNVLRRVPAAHALQDVVLHGLRIDADAVGAAGPEDGQLFRVQRVGTPGLYGIF